MKYYGLEDCREGGGGFAPYEIVRQPRGEQPTDLRKTAVTISAKG